MRLCCCVLNPEIVVALCKTLPLGGGAPAARIGCVCILCSRRRHRQWMRKGPTRSEFVRGRSFCDRAASSCACGETDGARRRVSNLELAKKSKSLPNAATETDDNFEKKEQGHSLFVVLVSPGLTFCGFFFGLLLLLPFAGFAFDSFGFAVTVGVAFVPGAAVPLPLIVWVAALLVAPSARWRYFAMRSCSLACRRFWLFSSAYITKNPQKPE